MERAEQAVSDDPATARPTADVTQDTAAGVKDPTGLALMDKESPHSHALDVTATDTAVSESEREGAAAPREADAGSTSAAANSDTSEEAGVEETSQAIQTVAQ